VSTTPVSEAFTVEESSIGVDDTAEEFLTGVNDTGEETLLVLMTPVKPSFTGVNDTSEALQMLSDLPRY
jgi:hypothetical protein